MDKQIFAVGQSNQRFLLVNLLNIDKDTIAFMMSFNKTDIRAEQLFSLAMSFFLHLVWYQAAFLNTNKANPEAYHL